MVEYQAEIERLKDGNEVVKAKTMGLKKSVPDVPSEVKVVGSETDKKVAELNSQI